LQHRVNFALLGASDIERYYKSDASALVDAWFPTGDIATDRKSVV
jgi:hypothetical protein